MHKVVCTDCKRFLGYITADGKGPIFDECPEKKKEGQCPMFRWLAPYQPGPSSKYRVGTQTGPLDPDAQGYQANARRALEDGA